MSYLSFSLAFPLTQADRSSRWGKNKQFLESNNYSETLNLGDFKDFLKVLGELSVSKTLTALAEKKSVTRFVCVLARCGSSTDLQWECLCRPANTVFYYFFLFCEINTVSRIAIRTPAFRCTQKNVFIIPGWLNFIWTVCNSMITTRHCHHCAICIQR